MPRGFHHENFNITYALLLHTKLGFLKLTILLPILTLTLSTQDLSNNKRLTHVCATLNFASPHDFTLAIYTTIITIVILGYLAGL